MNYHEHTEDVENFVAAKLKDLAAYERSRVKSTI